MHLNGGVLLGIAVLLARIIAITGTELSTNRFLRIRNIAKENDEERMTSMNSVPVVEKISRSVSFNAFHKIDPDVAVSQLVRAAQNSPKSEKIATSFQNKQLHAWLDGGVPPQTVFQFLALDTQGDNLFASPQFKAWLEYSMNFKKANPRTNTIPVIDTLAVYYSDEALVRIIKASKEAAHTKIRSDYFEKALFAKWVENKKTSAYISNMMGREMTPDEAFKLLTLDKAGDTTFTDPRFGTWLTFTKVFKKEHPKLKTNPAIDTLTTYLDDQVLSKLIKRAEQSPGMEEMATYVRNALLDKWVTDGKVPAFVVKKLGTSKERTAELLRTFLDKIKSRPPFKAEANVTRKRKRYANVVYN
ncbi:secreted RxLR effector peptide protein, putative [Phytophthora infestans T30-4]|uniref:Secreted RxLR effector peptide protein, putative n=2 Tax=Phytophthora infestans TaxID=4787 RepID=D0P0I4_PHYIT|nr:secreted RxLR effector peptide protein, putative [Phytophthora infestans T30-4]XP_002896213.1 secreted RxLR effector peptide protein, putative [Phytophthora infestans T30-4]EEY52946.1 secreted RxLR effector peptide protein, putative [Phytophthora infestans T30-4]EEY55087.1 secreted RxLR effector peptide protein, putative [Phytophthora infestans T30-4]KAF4147625.1 hypothetical protein GN958_ATG03198 [Phytophthora infestans]|eukprot:XP_002895717.1 secreted RxLR effector peptide protein, putative [Phytophthora infestans T30-4]